MPELSFRFLHAGAFRLDEPLHGLAEPPVEWIDMLADAPYVAAQHVFDTAIAESVDFVILCGQLLDLQRAGPRGMVFLLEQFQRLSEHKIAVYWAASEKDHWDRWPTGCRLPDNVHVFSLGHIEEVAHLRDDTTLTTIMGISGNSGKVRGTDFSGDYGSYTIAVAAGTPDKSLSRQPIDYWALSGSPSRETYFSKPRHAHDAGSPQGRSEQESGPHGCTLVKVANGRSTVTPVACDAVRWVAVEVEAPRGAKVETLEKKLDEQAKRLATDADRPHLVVWQVEGIERIEGASRDGKWRRKLAKSLQKSHGNFGETGCWTVRIDAVLPAEPPEKWLEENTMLGDFLREIQDYSFSGAAENSLRDRLVELGITSEMHPACDLSDREEQQRVLREASKLGADLLRGKA